MLNIFDAQGKPLRLIVWIRGDEVFRFFLKQIQIDSFFVQFDLSHDNDFLSIIDGHQINFIEVFLFPISPQTVIVPAGGKEILIKLFKKTAAIGLIVSPNHLPDIVEIPNLDCSPAAMDETKPKSEEVMPREELLFAVLISYKEYQRIRSRLTNCMMKLCFFVPRIISADRAGFRQWGRHGLYLGWA